MYDGALGRWFRTDPLSDKYYSFSPYTYVANNPVVFIDPDGKRIIFINGKIGGGSPPAGAEYWNGRGYDPMIHSESRFVLGAKKYFNDQSTYYTDVDYDYFSSADERREAGMKYAEENFSSLTQGMDKDSEVFHLVTHSMGGAFGDGVKEFLESKGWKVANVLSLNAFQAKDLKFKKGDQAFIVDYQNTDDPVLKLDGLGDDQIPEADLIIREKSGEKLTYIHRSPIDNADKFWKTFNKIVTDFLNEQQKSKERKKDR